MSRHKILTQWHNGVGTKYGYVAICLRGCPYSEDASMVRFKNTPRKIIWIPSRASPWYELCKKRFRQATYPICLAVPIGKWADALAVLPKERPKGIIRLGGYSDIAGSVTS